MLGWVPLLVVSLLVGCGASDGRQPRAGMFESSIAELEPVGSQPGKGGIGASVVGSPRDTTTGAGSAGGADDEVCSAIMQNVTLRVVDLESGVRLTITPHDLVDLEDLQESARALERRGKGGSSSACALVNLGERDAQILVAELADSVELDILTTPAQVPMVQQRIRDLARSAGVVRRP